MQRAGTHCTATHRENSRCSRWTVRPCPWEIILNFLLKWEVYSLLYCMYYECRASSKSSRRVLGFCQCVFDRWCVLWFSTAFCRSPATVCIISEFGPFQRIISHDKSTTDPFHIIWCYHIRTKSNFSVQSQNSEQIKKKVTLNLPWCANEDEEQHEWRPEIAGFSGMGWRSLFIRAFQICYIKSWICQRCNVKKRFLKGEMYIIEMPQQYHPAAQDRLPTEAKAGLRRVSTWMGDLLGKLGCCWKRCSWDQQWVLTLWSVWVLMPQFSDGDTTLSKSTVFRMKH